METVANFHRCEDAYPFKSYLESEDITAPVFDEFVPQNYCFYTIATGGIRVVVEHKDLERAEEIFREYDERTFQREPVVGSVKAWPVASFVVGVPLMLFGRSKLGKS